MGFVACFAVLLIAGIAALATDVFEVRDVLSEGVRHVFGWDEAGASGDGPSDVDAGNFVLLDGGFTDERIDDEKSARKALEPVAESLGISDVDEELATCREDEALDNRYYRFFQSYEGIPVYGRSMVVGADEDGRALNLSSNVVSVEGVETDPSVSREDAIATAEKALGDRDAVLFSSGLTIYAPDGATPELAWELQFISEKPGSSCLVSAQTGKALLQGRTFQAVTERGSGTGLDGKKVSFNMDREGDNYRLIDNERGITILNLEGKGIQNVKSDIQLVDENGGVYYLMKSDSLDAHVWFNEDGVVCEVTAEGPVSNWRVKKPDGKTVKIVSTRYDTSRMVTSADGTWNNADAVTLMDSVSTIYDYYLEVLGRRSFDGKGGALYATCGVDMQNAFAWAPSVEFAQIVAGKGLPYAGRIVIAHEYAHAVTANICGLSGAPRDDAGPLNEAISDVVAMACEDWADNGAPDGSVKWEIEGTDRNLTDPGSNSLPSQYQGENWWEGNTDPSNSSNVSEHHNSTVLSHAFYLMCEDDGLAGGVITTDQMGKLMYLTLLSIPSDCDFTRFRICAENAAEIMNSQGLLTSGEVQRVAAAFNEVAIPKVEAMDTITRNARLNVFDLNGDPYSAYEVKVTPSKLVPSNIEDMAPGKTQSPVKRDSWTLAPDSQGNLSFDFQYDGVYVLTLTDKNNTAKQWTCSVLVGASSSNSLDLYTNFGSVDKESDTGKQAAKFAAQQNVALVLDVSSSMDDDVQQLRDAAGRFVETAAEGGAKLGIVSYSDQAKVLAPLGSDSSDLKDAVDDLTTYGNTNIEDGLATARSMLKGTSGNRTIVLMSDGAANAGKTGQDLVAYAQQLKDEGIRIFSVGFGLSGDAQSIMRSLASEGRHYEANNAQSLEGFFQDIASELNGTKFMLVRAACPVDVSVTYDGETLSSAEDDRNLRASFGSLSFEEEVDAQGNATGEQIKVLRLKEGADYDVDVVGTGDGSMDYSIGFVDDQGDYSDFRTFSGIPITPSTYVASTASVASETHLAVDEDGDGTFDQAYSAGANEEGQLVDSRWLVRLTLVGCALLTLLLVYLRFRKPVRYLRGRYAAPR